MKLRIKSLKGSKRANVQTGLGHAISFPSMEQALAFIQSGQFHGRAFSINENNMGRINAWKQ